MAKKRRLTRKEVLAKVHKSRGTVGVTGVTNILKNLKKAKLRSGKELERGLVKAGLFLQRESQLVVPVDDGPLKASAFTRKKGSHLNTEVIVGYTQNYAIYVHEDLDAQHNPGQTAKFLERPARENKDKLRDIIAGEMKF